MEHPNMVQEICRITGVNPRKCMRCGKCSATCPAYGEMEYHPHQFVAMIERGAVEESAGLPGHLAPPVLHGLPGAVPPGRGARHGWWRRSG
ncbi:MAG: 4Fe-4S dicluster domain-containing protein [Oscillospiraceae bacterium]